MMDYLATVGLTFLGVAVGVYISSPRGPYAPLCQPVDTTPPTTAELR